MYVSIVIPCYNESASLEASVTSIHHTVTLYYEVFFNEFEIILVVEKSSDNTLEIARKLETKYKQVRVLENDATYGKGYSVRRGVLESLGQYIFVVDADLPINLYKYIRIMMLLIEDPKAAAIYCTALWDKINFKKRKKIRALTSIGLFILRKLILKQGVSDSQFGCKLYEGDVARMCFNDVKVNNFLYEIYVTDWILSKGYHIDECAVSVESFSKNSTVKLSSIVNSFFTFMRYALFERRRFMKKLSLSSVRSFLIVISIGLIMSFVHDEAALADKKVELIIESEQFFNEAVVQNVAYAYGKKKSHPWKP
ncbi:MAG: hypothetical protein CVU84_07135 [Firmicutes bacterium HGW-Firmicutes-1]|jgi:glycosyltransferase involved in cell wall biosynthesis|nr:MAG: hypothetical protein CVU84_07135 [Firmicutes bacterium HGW-Firmicutes-1]